MLSGHVPERFPGGIGPGQEFVDAAVGMAIDDLGDDVGEIDLRIDGIEFAALDQQCDDFPIFGSPSEPAKSTFFRFNAIGLMERSTTIEPISIRPSSMKLVRRFHRARA